MEPTSSPHAKLEPGVFQGTPELSQKPKNDTPSAPRIMRTMKSDSAEAIRRQNETSVSIVIAEQKKQEKARAESAVEKQAQTQPTAPAPKPIGRIVIVVVLLLIAVALGLAYVFVLPKLGAIKIQMPNVSIPSFGKPAAIAPIATTAPEATRAPSLIPAASEKRFDIAKESRTQVSAEITTEMEKKISAGEIINLYFTEGAASSTAVTASRLFAFTELSAPEILVRSLEKPFMAGFFGEDNGDATPFLVLKVSSYEAGLAGMLDWETSLTRSFGSVFGAMPGRTATSTTKFRDTVILGKDARSAGRVRGDISYVFANQNTIVIAGSQSALEAILTLAGKI